MKLSDLLNEAFDVEFGQYIILDHTRPGHQWSADTKKDIIDAIMANSIKEWQVVEADTSDILADWRNDSILDGKITPKDESFSRIKELMFDIGDDMPDHAAFPKVKADMEVVDPALDSE
jgi:hypothetical protein